MLTQPAPNLASALMEYFVGRRSACASKSRGEWFPYRRGPKGKRKDVAISLSLIKQHLAGGRPIGVYLIGPGSNTVRFAAFDIDDHAGTNAAGVAATTRALRNRLREHGLQPLVVRSGGGHGTHVILFWSTPQSAATVRAFLRSVLDSIDTDCQVDIFPRQDAVPVGGYGNLLALPFAEESCLLDECLEPAPLSAFVPEYSRPL